MWVQSLGWEDSLEEGMATHSGILVWRIPWTEESGELQSMGSQRVRHTWSNLVYAHTTPSRNWQTRGRGGGNSCWTSKYSWISISGPSRLVVSSHIPYKAACAYHILHLTCHLQASVKLSYLLCLEALLSFPTCNSLFFVTMYLKGPFHLEGELVSHQMEGASRGPVLDHRLYSGTEIKTWWRCFHFNELVYTSHDFTFIMVLLAITSTFENNCWSGASIPALLLLFLSQEVFHDLPLFHQNQEFATFCLHFISQKLLWISQDFFDWKRWKSTQTGFNWYL